MLPLKIESARPNDEAAILHLVTSSDLPSAGLVDHLDNAIVARFEDRVVGCAALEIYDDGALLRSVAVEPAARGTGLGHTLVCAALELARHHGVTSVYLLTTTAENYFTRFGFEKVSREVVPEGVRSSVEFRTACPASAAVLATNL